MFLDILKSKLPELKIKNKAVIALGCSFVHGQSAFDLDFDQTKSGWNPTPVIDLVAPVPVHVTAFIY